MRRLGARRGLVVACAALAMAAAFGCSGGDARQEAETEVAASQAKAPEEKDAARPRAASPTLSGEKFWADIPVYADARPVEKIDSLVPKSGEMGEFRTLKFRHWETDADVGTVADFYLEEMPGHGWTKVVAMDFNRPTSAMSSWIKRDGDVVANVSVGRDASGTIYISVMRAEGAA